MNFFFSQSMPSCEEELMPFNMTRNIRPSLSCSIRLRVMASVLLPQSPGTIWVGLGSVALTGTAGGGRAPAADRLQCSGDRLMWHWATAGLQQRVSGALLFRHLDDVWHFISSPVALRNSTTAAWLSTLYSAQVFSKIWEPIQQSKLNALVYKECSRKHFYKHKNFCSVIF